jgi:nucleoid DNA-binding protein
MASNNGGAIALSEAELIEETVKRLPDMTASQMRKVLTALKEEIVDCVTQGYKVSLSGIVSLEPTVKAGRKKGTVVHNPFDGTSKTLRADEPDKFVLKVRRSSSISNKFPTLRTADGKALHDRLYVKPKATAKKR